MSEIDDLLQRGLAAHQAGRLDDALAIYQEVLREHPANANALNLLGMLHHQQGRQIHAEELIRRAIEAAPTVAPFHANLGNVLLAQNRMEHAEDAYRKAIELQGDYVEAHNNLGVALLGQGKVDESIQQLARTINMRHNYPAARNNLGNALRARYMYKEAVAMYRDAIAQDPIYAEAHSNLAIALLAMNETDEAMAEARAALALKPDHPGANFTLGMALERVGRNDEAIASYREALRLKPNSRGLRFQLASITGEEAFEAAPAEYVSALFDNYADTFDKHLLVTLKYRAPELIVDAVKRAKPQADAVVVDLGCGTGLCGPLLRPLAKHLTGVDLSGRMIGQARERKVYDDLFVDELVAFLSVRYAQFDLAVASDVFGYIGDLRPILAAAAQALRPDGLLAFTVEKNDGEGYLLSPTRRYAHSIGYIRSALLELPWDEVSATEAVLRVEKKQDVAGWVIVLRRRS